MTPEQRAQLEDLAPAAALALVSVQEALAGEATPVPAKIIEARTGLSFSQVRGALAALTLRGWVEVCDEGGGQRYRATAAPALLGVKQLLAIHDSVDRQLQKKNEFLAGVNNLARLLGTDAEVG